MALDGDYGGRMVISGTLKPDAAEALERLNKKTIQTVLFTGDTRMPKEAMETRLNIDSYFPELMPEDKVKHIKMLIKKSSEGKIIFDGDGINDAPVLTCACAGIKMRAPGLDAAVETSHVVLMTDSPLKVAEAIGVAQKTRAVVWQDIFFAPGVKLVFIVPGIAGIATMWKAVLRDMGVALIAGFDANGVL